MSSSPSGATAVGRPEAAGVQSIAVRAMDADDLPACADVFYSALDRLSEDRHEAPAPRNETSMLRLYARLLASHPAGSAVAEADGRIIGFGIAVERERSWFLGFLFVEPAWQAEGIGRRVLERILPASGVDAWLADGGSLATCAEAIQLTSTGLYTSLGMRPRDPIYLLVGTPRPETLRPLPATVEGCAVRAAGVDRSAPPGWTSRWRRSTSRRSATAVRSTTAMTVPRVARASSSAIGVMAARWAMATSNRAVASGRPT